MARTVDVVINSLVFVLFSLRWFSAIEILKWFSLSSVQFYKTDFSEWACAQASQALLVSEIDVLHDKFKMLYLYFNKAFNQKTS